MQYPAAKAPTRGFELLRERLYCVRFVVLDIENGVQLGNLQKVVNLFGEIEQLQLSAAIANGGEGTYQLTDPRAVDIGDISEVQQNFLVPLGDHVTNDIPEHGATFA